jgi:hypothetical protein
LPSSLNAESGGSLLKTKSNGGGGDSDALLFVLLTPFFILLGEVVDKAAEAKFVFKENVGLSKVLFFSLIIVIMGELLTTELGKLLRMNGVGVKIFSERILEGSSSEEEDDDGNSSKYPRAGRFLLKINSVEALLLLQNGRLKIVFGSSSSSSSSSTSPSDLYSFSFSSSGTKGFFEEDFMINVPVLEATEARFELELSSSSSSS